VLGVGKSLPDDGGNVFVADTNHGAIASGPGGGPYASVSWDSANELVVRYREGARVFKTEESFRGTHVHFVPESDMPNNAFKRRRAKTHAP
jgi:hypothetical protein